MSDIAINTREVNSMPAYLLMRVTAGEIFRPPTSECRDEIVSSVRWIIWLLVLSLYEHVQIPICFASACFGVFVDLLSFTLHNFRSYFTTESCVARSDREFII